MIRFIKGVVGTGTVVLLGCLAGQAAYAQPLGIGGSKAVAPPQYHVLSSDGGRYVFGQISDSAKDQFMLDTATGRLWRMGESGKVGVFLKAVPYRDAKGACTFLPDKIPDAGEAKPGEK